ncbi:fumarylacetoacetate hydrolase family protein [Sulfitobacter sp. F26204]|uniref:fumarylacetoacetate hydrolase family protein n=1 Tax=Sulfitobacter sp. F26204 TaxID=2996014 RepID=UPI00225E451D|nr:fumarylacetoacetate hydrolase family protein [Sulfitobacter sp. F26204]MCX7561662.1 fumarylacetoacetate hydrolase family protein [Sulfitobacter sp. F26204]
MTEIFAYRDADGQRRPCVRSAAGLVAVDDSWADLLGRMCGPVAAQPTLGRPLPDRTRICTPMPEGGTLYAIGVNYADHAQAGMQVMRDMGFRDPAVAAPRPVFFTKPAGACLADPGAQVTAPQGCEAFDVEVELCAVIGKAGKHIAEADALGHVAAYCIALDMSARDFQMLPGTLFGVDLFAGKVFDGACPMGPCLCPAAQVGDPAALAIGVAVNGQTWQQSDTGQMTMGLPGIIAALSQLVTLRPGDAILTGTPAGTGFETGRTLQSGDRISAWIDTLGQLSVEVG